MEDRRVKVHEVMDAVSISIDRVHNIVHKKKITNKEAVCMMSAAIAANPPKAHEGRNFKAVFIDVCSISCGLFVSIWDSWRDVAASLLHHCTPESKQQSEQLTGPWKCLKKADCFLGWKFDDYWLRRLSEVDIDRLLNQCHNNNRGIYYAQLLDPLKEELCITRKR